MEIVRFRNKKKSLNENWGSSLDIEDNNFPKNVLDTLQNWVDNARDMSVYVNGDIIDFSWGTDIGFSYVGKLLGDKIKFEIGSGDLIGTVNINDVTPKTFSIVFNKAEDIAGAY